MGKVANGAPVDLGLSMVGFRGSGGKAYMLIIPEKGSKV